MTIYDVFNGDADGICALLQLRQIEPTGVCFGVRCKARYPVADARVMPSSGDHVNVLDISLDKNRADLERILDQGASVFYVDHHYAGAIPEHDQLSTVINLSPEVSTSALINGYLKGKRAGWAVVGCYGDNLSGTAEKIAATLDDVTDLARWQQLGVLMNYNGYGATVEDLHFSPVDLYQRLLPHDSPQDCLIGDPDLIDTLAAAYDDDMRWR